MSDQAIIANAKFAAEYLEHYGYQVGQPRDASGRQAVTEGGLRAFQEFAGLAVTGQLDAETVAKMREPRCGCRDTLRSLDQLALARWRKNRLTYFIEKRVSQLDPATVDAQIRAAFDDWEKCCDIKFAISPSRTDADLIISIGSGAADNFDGPGSTLAWAFLPNGADGQLLMRFDAAENWTVAGNGIRFRNVACHEFGHMIGLEHSRVQSALMAPFYSPAVVSPQQADDISRVRALYGPPVSDQPPGDPADPKTFCNLYKQLTAKVNELRHAKEFTMAGITFDENDKKNLNTVLAAVTSPTCEKITAALGNLAKLCPPAPAAAPAFMTPWGMQPQPAIGGGLCAALPGVLALLPVLQQLLAVCKPTATA